MAIREVLTYPDRRLKQLSSPLETVDENVRRIVTDLRDTLNASAGCVGVAAPQIAEPVRIVVIDASRARKPCANHGLLVLINPVLTASAGEVLGREGCLSLPDFTANVKRAQRITLWAKNESWENVEFESVDFEARLILHEMDHLDGILFLDRVSSLKTDVFRRKTSSAVMAELKASAYRVELPDQAAPAPSQKKDQGGACERLEGL